MAQYTIQDVSVEVARKGKNTWNIAKVIYDNKGETKEKQVVSFKNPDVFKTVEGLKNGDVVEVSFAKDDPYYNWAGIKVLGGTPSAEKASAPQQAGGKVIGSNYETREERAARQILIVRQSSLSTAVEALGPKKTQEEYLELATAFENWVMREDKKDPPKEELTDVPF